MFLLQLSEQSNLHQLSISISPAILLLLYSVVIYASTLLLAVSLSQYRWHTEQARSPINGLSPFWYLTGTLGMLLFLGWLFFRTSYYDHFVLSMGFLSLFVVWCTALFLATVPQLLFQSEGCLLRVLVLFGGLYFAYLYIMQPSELAQETTAVLLGPQSAHGSIDETYTGGGRSVRLFASINGVAYEVPDRVWFATLKRGQDVAFLHDPATTVAFGPSSQALSIRGMAFLCIVVALWIATLFVICRGLIIVGGRIERYLRGEKPA